MNAGMVWLVLEPLLLCVAITLSALYAARRLWPDAFRRARVRLALALLRATQPAWLQRIGRAIAPAPALARVDANAGCGPCRGCDKSGG